MAKKNQQAAAGNQGSDAFDESGFISVSSDRAAPFFKMEEGNKLAGVLLGAYDMPDEFNKGQRRDFIQLRLLTPTQVAIKGEDGTETLERGKTVSVGITSGLTDILTKQVPLVDAGAEVHLLIEVTGRRQKVKNSNNTFWPCEYKRKLVRPPTMPVVARVARAEVVANGVSGKAGGKPFEEEAGF